jgi:hypothetical protein
VERRGVSADWMEGKAWDAERVWLVLVIGILGAFVSINC